MNISDQMLFQSPVLVSGVSLHVYQPKTI